jgi:hypothetical protein
MDWYASVLNLDKDKKRWADIDTALTLSNIPHRRFPAICGRTLGDEMECPNKGYTNIC